MMERIIIPSSVKNGFLMRVAGIMVILTEELSQSNEPPTMFFQVALSFPERL